MNNVILTSLISFRLIQAQKHLVSVLPNTTHGVYIGIVSILVESAAPAALIGIAYSVSLFAAAQSDNAIRAAYITQILFISVGVRGQLPIQVSRRSDNRLQVLAPQLIIFRVATGTSWANKEDTTAMFSQPIAFNNGTRNTRTDEEESGSDIENSRRD